MQQHRPPRLYFDEHLSPRLAAQLQKYGFDAVTLHQREMLSKNDREQLAVAVSEKRAIVTCNFSDFISLDKEYSASCQHHWGILLTTEEPTGILLKRLLKLLNVISADELKNQVRWLNEFK